MSKHFIIPDCQIAPGVPLDHLDWIGRAIVEYAPDVVVNLGDMADMHSLSSYKTNLESEGTRYWMDILAVKEGMDVLMAPLRRKWGKNLQKSGAPRLVLTLGNHEARISRAVADQPKLADFMGLFNLPYEENGWEVYPFLEIVEIDGIHYSHYFQARGSGRPVAGMIETRIKTIGFPFIHGHQQGLKTGMVSRNNGQLVRGIVAGSCYLHSEDYLGQTDSADWRGCLILNDVRRGQYSLMELDLDYLSREFGTGEYVWQFMKKNYPKLSAHSPWLAQERLSRTGR